MNRRNIPFEVGQCAEARSFLPGYRGAWFRCKILSITRRKTRVAFELEFFDFPDEKVSWTPLYQIYNGKLYVMIRPTYPTKFLQSQMPEKLPFEVIVAQNDTWKAGDAVDWWTTTSHWSGWITEVLANGNCKVELWPPPDGEGHSYVASGRDFRPTLVWSPDNGWTLPEENEMFRPCGRLIHPSDVVEEIGEEIGNDCVEGGESEGCGGSNEGQSAGSSGNLDCEAAIIDIIELLHKIKWMKRHLCEED